MTNGFMVAAGEHAVRRQPGDKAGTHGGRAVVVNCWLTSGKGSSHCGDTMGALKRRRRSWIFEVCGTSHDRDMHAVLNINREAGSSVASAWGEVGGLPGTPGGFPEFLVKTGLGEAGGQHQT